ncbi:hypothetical protein FA09DRAFT_47904 [Tilletiopsis washingtonensis]|jgi:hypothetical protein|uniref:Uncharacterized protein n=1 Tax=Tilletiopsis washingtonensis TaxID=58919 RepID=A0A316Z8A9_9BASI|nr:hypothetical protein FA09DRAFT_47904 [Tilletiopsis washingtonensis]PWN97274.1 hypothetical protein FA09DRAFT_47904 [Tilletiopsis washingtonensis]
MQVASVCNSTTGWGSSPLFTGRRTARLCRWCRYNVPERSSSRRRVLAHARPCWRLDAPRAALPAAQLCLCFARQLTRRPSAQGSVEHCAVLVAATADSCGKGAGCCAPPARAQLCRGGACTPSRRSILSAAAAAAAQTELACRMLRHAYEGDAWPSAGRWSCAAGAAARMCFPAWRLGAARCRHGRRAASEARSHGVHSSRSLAASDSRLLLLAGEKGGAKPTPRQRRAVSPSDALRLARVRVQHRQGSRAGRGRCAR